MKAVVDQRYYTKKKYIATTHKEKGTTIMHAPGRTTRMEIIV